MGATTNRQAGVNTPTNINTYKRTAANAKDNQANQTGQHKNKWTSRLMHIHTDVKTHEHTENRYTDTQIHRHPDTQTQAADKHIQIKGKPTTRPTLNFSCEALGN